MEKNRLVSVQELIAKAKDQQAIPPKNRLKLSEPTPEEQKRLDRIEMMLRYLPAETDDEFDDLSSWEQEFISSVRTQFERKGELSINQEEVLEQIWKKYG